MNDKIPITKPLHPKFIIQYAVNSVARMLYSVNWEPRVVRQEARKIEGSSLSNIDYAIPCFDLAQKLGKDVVSVAGEMAAELKKKLYDASETEYFQFIQSESIHGYLNFEIADEFLVDVIKNSAEWYGEPSSIIQSSPIFVGIMGYNVVEVDQNENLIHALKLIESVAFVVDQAFEAEVEIPDASIEALEELAKRVVQSENIQLESSAIMQKKKLLRNRLSQLGTPQSIGQEYEETLENIVKLFRQIASSDFTKARSQLDLIEPANRTIEKIINEKNKLTDLFIVDEANLAIYLSFEDTVVPVRSAEGFLYPAAYMIYQIESHIAHQAAAQVIFAPHKHHGFLRLIIERLKEDIEYVLYDPFVSRADVTEIIASVGTFKSLIDTVYGRIRNTEKLESLMLSRSQLFFIADFAMDISLSLRELQFPLFFDNLNQLARIATSVTSDEGRD